ncbi:MAG: hypothetical protein AAFX44_06370 [Pseudomonadota bacterium]
MSKPTDKRPPKPATDDEQATTSIELMSTTILREMLDTDEITVDDLEAAASGETDGMLGRNEDGGFEVLEKVSLDDLMNAAPTAARPPERSRNRPPEFDYGSRDKPQAPPKPESKPKAGQQQNVRQITVPETTDDIELELVDTQMLRVILDEQLVAQGKDPKFNVEEEPEANPYNSATDPEPKSRFAPEPKRTDEFNPYNTGSSKKK